MSLHRSAARRVRAMAKRLAWIGLLVASTISAVNSAQSTDLFPGVPKCVEMILMATEFCPGGYRQSDAPDSIPGLLHCSRAPVCGQRFRPPPFFQNYDGIYDGLAHPFVGELATFRRCPPGWLPADGRLLPKVNHQALFSLLNSRFGGDPGYYGNFALPRVPQVGELITCIADMGYFPDRYKLPGDVQVR